MNREVEAYINSARVPESLQPQTFGLWTITRYVVGPDLPPAMTGWIGFKSMTMLYHMTTATMHTDHGDLVMEDSRRELQRHLPIWLRAKGRVLVTGLGLGCVVRGLLASPKIEHITVIEIDPDILRIIGAEFAQNDRVRLIHGDALKVKLNDRFDFAWHDLWTDGETHLQIFHTRLIRRFRFQCHIQGAWQLPRMFKRLAPSWVLR